MSGTRSRAARRVSPLRGSRDGRQRRPWRSRLRSRRLVVGMGMDGHQVGRWGAVSSGMVWMLAHPVTFERFPRRRMAPINRPMKKSNSDPERLRVAYHRRRMTLLPRLRTMVPEMPDIDRIRGLRRRLRAVRSDDPRWCWGRRTAPTTTSTRSSVSPSSGSMAGRRSPSTMSSCHATVLWMVHAGLPRGAVGRRTRTAPQHVAIKMGPYQVRGFIDSFPGRTRSRASDVASR